jgi:hypothetical protein
VFQGFVKVENIAQVAGVYKVIKSKGGGKIWIRDGSWFFNVLCFLLWGLVLGFYFTKLI